MIYALANWTRRCFLIGQRAQRVPLSEWEVGNAILALQFLFEEKLVSTYYSIEKFQLGEHKEYGTWEAGWFSETKVMKKWNLGQRRAWRWHSLTEAFRDWRKGNSVKQETNRDDAKQFKNLIKHFPPPHLKCCISFYKGALKSEFLRLQKGFMVNDKIKKKGKNRANTSLKYVRGLRKTNQTEIYYQDKKHNQDFTVAEVSHPPLIFHSNILWNKTNFSKRASDFWASNLIHLQGAWFSDSNEHSIAFRF